MFSLDLTGQGILNTEKRQAFLPLDADVQVQRTSMKPPNWNLLKFRQNYLASEEFMKISRRRNHLIFSFTK